MTTKILKLAVDTEIEVDDLLSQLGVEETHALYDAIDADEFLEHRGIKRKEEP